MRQFICPLLILGLVPTAGTSAQSCSTFAACDQLARAVRDKDDLYTAQAHYQTACFAPVAEALLNLCNNACLAVTAISSELDNYASAYSFFNKACNDGADAGCFHLALLENDRGNAHRAMEIMQPLCDRQYAQRVGWHLISRKNAGSIKEAEVQCDPVQDPSQCLSMG